MRAVCILDDCGHLQNTFPYCSMHMRRLRRNGTVRRLTDEDRFFRHVTEDDNGCWAFDMVNPATGYCQFPVDKGIRQVSAHGWSYEFFVGEIPEGLELDHLCSNPPCVNPAHLEPVTHRENSRRGVGSREECVNGHRYDASNTTTRPNGHRTCRTCARQAQVRYRANRAS